MPNLSQRIAKASKDSVDAKRRIIAAETQIMQCVLAMLDDDEPPPLPNEVKPTPSKPKQPKK